MRSETLVSDHVQSKHRSDHQYLLSNWGQHNNVTLVAAICTSQSGLGLFKISQEDGTARVRPATDGVAMIETSLDTIVADYPAFEKANVIKIDTDGYDFEVIAGARELIANNLPAVLFECDVFDSSSYVENCLSTFEFFAKCGYQHFLLYDNLGFFFGQYSLVDLQPFKNLLIYQITGRRCYFDILLMREEDLAEFLLLENNFFADIVSNLSLAQTIRVAMQ